MTLDHPAVATHVTWLTAEPPCCKLSHCEATILKRNELVFIQSQGESAGRQDDVQSVNTISMTIYIILHGRQHFWSHQRHVKRSSDKGGRSEPSTSLNTTWKYKSWLSGSSNPPYYWNSLTVSNIASTVVHTVTIALTNLNAPRVMVVEAPTHSIVWRPFGCTSRLVVASPAHHLALVLVMLPVQIYVLLEMFWHLWMHPGS